MALHLIKSKKVSPSIMKKVSMAGATTKVSGKRPTGRQGKIRSGTRKR